MNKTRRQYCIGFVLSTFYIISDIIKGFAISVAMMILPLSFVWASTLNEHQMFKNFAIDLIMWFVALVAIISVLYNMLGIIYALTYRTYIHKYVMRVYVSTLVGILIFSLPRMMVSYGDSLGNLISKSFYSFILWGAIRGCLWLYIKMLQKRDIHLDYAESYEIETRYAKSLYPVRMMSGNDCDNECLSPTVSTESNVPDIEIDNTEDVINDVHADVTSDILLLMPPEDVIGSTEYEILLPDVMYVDEFGNIRGYIL